MPADKRVLVVGTTSDYIHWIQNRYPGAAVFLTDPLVRKDAGEPAPPPDCEVLCPLTEFDRSDQALHRHLAAHGLLLEGVVSFDCESMALAAFLAPRFGLTYPTPQAVDSCRNKYLTKKVWRDNMLDAPRVRMVASEEEAVLFLREAGGDCVLKPASGSGSELIFRCEDEPGCRSNYRIIEQGLKRRGSHRLYRPFTATDGAVILAESLVSGDEYSCDFIIHQDEVRVLRITRKIFDRGGHFGTTLGYQLVETLPATIDAAYFEQTLKKSAQALGLDRALCMVDFMVRDGRIILLELAPRPGGDCLPFLLRRAMGLDILKFFIDFASPRPVRLPDRAECRPAIGLRVLARRAGVLKQIDVQRLQGDESISEVGLTRRPGHRVIMPPEDYDSWCLGYIIFEPRSDADLEEQCRSVLERVTVKFE